MGGLGLLRGRVRQNDHPSFNARGEIRPGVADLSDDFAGSSLGVDTAVHEKCGDPFWTELAAAMTEHFKRGDFTAGLVHGIEHAGVLLAEHFPRASDDRNELPNEVEETD